MILSIFSKNSMTFPGIPENFTLSTFSKNSMTFPEIPENFKIPENPWLFHDRGNPGPWWPLGGIKSKDIFSLFPIFMVIVGKTKGSSSALLWILHLIFTYIYVFDKVLEF